MTCTVGDVMIKHRGPHCVLSGGSYGDIYAWPAACGLTERGGMRVLPSFETSRMIFLQQCFHTLPSTVALANHKLQLDSLFHEEAEEKKKKHFTAATLKRYIWRIGFGGCGRGWQRIAPMRAGSEGRIFVYSSLISSPQKKYTVE